jgi:hypothetical protein
LSLALAALDAFDRASEAEELTWSDLAAITEAATCRFSSVGRLGADLLMRLACRSEKAQGAIRHILTEGPGNARLQVIGSVNGDLPKPFLVEIVTLALRDKAKRVRAKVIEVCHDLSLDELLPVLERKMDEESDSLVADSLRRVIAILRQKDKSV